MWFCTRMFLFLENTPRISGSEEYDACNLLKKFFRKKKKMCRKKENANMAHVNYW